MSGPGTRLLLLLLPGGWRARYGAELAELLDAGDRPLRDALDVARLAAGLRLATTMEVIMRTLWTLAAVLALLGAAGAAWSAANLDGGLAEIPGHWWSTLATSPLAGAAVVALVAVRRRAAG